MLLCFFAFKKQRKPSPYGVIKNNVSDRLLFPIHSMIVKVPERIMVLEVIVM